jgi:hypothetical protein
MAFNPKLETYAQYVERSAKEWEQEKERIALEKKAADALVHLSGVDNCTPGFCPARRGGLVKPHEMEDGKCKHCGCTAPSEGGGRRKRRTNRRHRRSSRKNTRKHRARKH